MIHVSFQAIHERSPGPRWQALFERFWPAYRRWFFAAGHGERPPRVVAEKSLRKAMPELWPIYRRLLELSGDDNEHARFLALYRPAPYVTGCSQAVWTGDEPVLIRNYDYAPDLWEGVLLSSAWNGRRVLAMSDCLWGALDGINDAGLAVSLAFGGRPHVGDGFGCPLLLRYVLEFCDNARDAVRALSRIPTHMAYNVTLVDARGEFYTVYLAPGREAEARRWPLATNHQADDDWSQYVALTSSLERERWLADRLGDPTRGLDELIDDFGRPPLCAGRYAEGIGTLYTAVYRPAQRRMELRWPGRQLARGVEETGEESFALSLGS